MIALRVTQCPGRATLRTPGRPIFSAAHRRPLGSPVPAPLKKKKTVKRAPLPCQRASYSPEPCCLSVWRTSCRSRSIDRITSCASDRSARILRGASVERGAPKRHRRPRPPRAAGAAAPAPPSSRAAASFGGSCEHRRQMSASFTDAGTQGQQMRTASSSC